MKSCLPLRPVACFSAPVHDGPGVGVPRAFRQGGRGGGDESPHPPPSTSGSIDPSSRRATNNPRPAPAQCCRAPRSRTSSSAPLQSRRLQCCRADGVKRHMVHDLGVQRFQLVRFVPRDRRAHSPRCRSTRARSAMLSDPSAGFRGSEVRQIGGNRQWFGIPASRRSLKAQAADPLGQRLAVGPHHQRHMGKGRHADSQGPGTSCT